MNMTFRLRFRTNYGQSLSLTGDHELLGNGQTAGAVPLHYRDPEHWEVAIPWTDADALNGGKVRYRYILRNAGGSVFQDQGHGPVIDSVPAGCDELLIVDSWNHPGFFENTFYTRPFKEVLLKANRSEVRVPAVPKATHTFKVKAPLLPANQTLCLLGDGAILGNWNTAAPTLLGRDEGGDFLCAQLDLTRQTLPVAYKYGVYDLERKTFIRYENGANRVLLDAVAPGKHTIVNDGFAVLPADTWKGAGVAIPVFSLRSKNSFGVGEFTDLKLLVDWGRQVGLKLIQLLPINDTIATNTWADSYPYSAISAFALHPIYLNLAHLVRGEAGGLPPEVEAEGRRLNSLDAVDYPAVITAKLGYLRRIFPTHKARTFRHKDYSRFFADNQHWLTPYAVFSHLRDLFGTADFSQWPRHREYREEEVAVLADKDSPTCDAIAFYYFLQYHLHLQLKEATEYARANGIVVKGDIPIGVYRHGADAWQQPELFRMDVQAGAPPDAFAEKGQNWGFPTYNWPRMEANRFAWWSRRFEQMSRYFDAFRIDHILGFFRIWSIPTHAVEGILGHFVPAIPVAPEEFSRRGIPFERDRFLKPWITDAVLLERFGSNAEMVKRDYLQADSPGGYSFKPEFATQRKVEAYFAGLEPNERHRQLKEGLYDLMSNVLLLEAEDSHERGLHFRFGIANTSSFRHLPPGVQSPLQELYVDYFFRRQDAFWAREALQKLPALKRVTNMLICGEDLGMVPDCVPVVMKDLGLLCLEVQRMPKRLNQRFSRPADAPYLSVVTPSTHDMSTVRGWWEEDRDVTQTFFNHELGWPGEAPRQCEPWINQAILLQHLSSPAIWSIFQLQDLLGIDAALRRADPAVERINVPAITGHHWRYRLHLTLEQLRDAADFNQGLKQLIRQSGR